MKYVKVTKWQRIKGTSPRRWRKVQKWKKAFPNATHYSPHFSKAELRCKCGCTPNKHVDKALEELAWGLEQMRMVLGHGIGVASGHRCYKRNEAVGGARMSQHLLGTAADLVVPRGQQDRYVKAALKVKIFRNGGIGNYGDGRVHVDHREGAARWRTYSR